MLKKTYAINSNQVLLDTFKEAMLKKMGFADKITGELENIDTLWHQTPDAWQGASAGQETHAELAARFLYLMGNQTDFRLVISILGPDAKERREGGVFSDDNEKLISLLAELDKVGVHPKLVYHPGLQKESADWGNGGLKATTDDMAAFNQSIATITPKIIQNCRFSLNTC